MFIAVTHRPATSLGHQWGRRVRGAQNLCIMSNRFELCPKHFSRGGKTFSRGGFAPPRPPPLVTGPVTHCSVQRVKAVRVQKCAPGTSENGGMRKHFLLCTFKRGATGTQVPFHNSIIGNFMVYQDRLEINIYSYSGTQIIQNNFL